MKFSPHLCFDGQCKAAFLRYQQLFGGVITTMLSYGEAPTAANILPEWHSRILHASLSFGDFELTGVDMLPSTYANPQGFFVTLTIADFIEAERIFRSLAEDGETRVPFERTFWSEGFGVLTDRFGIPWEINCALTPPAAST